jgi:hypothetical protein
LTEPDVEAAVTRAAERFEVACASDPERRACRPLYVVAEKILGRATSS